MASASSKAIPFVVLLIAAGFGAIDTFTEFTISDEMINLLAMILAPMGVGGLVNKAWNSWKNVKITENNL